MPYPHRDILAVTFTNKATEEMTKRIVHELALLAGRERGWEDKGSPYLENLIKDLGLTGSSNPQSLLAEYAGKSLDALLADFDHFGVSTIDAFFQTILRAFAREAELAGDYELELDDKTLVGDAVARLLSDIDNNVAPDYDPGNEQLSRQLKALMTMRLDESNDPNIFSRNGSVQREVVEYINSITNESFALNNEEIVKFFADTDRFTKFLEALADTSAVEEELRQCCRGLDGLLQGANAHTLKLFSDPDKYILEPALPKGKTFETALNDPAKNFNKGKATPEKIELLHTAAMTLKKLIGRLRYLKELHKQMGRTTILKRILDAMEAQRADTSTILLSDTNSLLRNIIDDDETPFIYERTGNRYRHFLIDEFQDTSSMQWEIFKPLLREALSRNEAPHGDNESLIIGDEKQSIYGFRNSDASMLTRLSEGKEITDSQATTSEHNWRSSHTVVEFNNAFFAEAVADDASLANLYNNVHQNPVKKTERYPGFIQAQPLTAEENKGMNVEEIIDNIILQLERGYRPGDIAVLVRTNSLAQTFIEQAGEISRREIPEDCEPEERAWEEKRLKWLSKMKFAGEESVTLASSPLVQLVINILRFVGAGDFTLYHKNLSEKELALIFSSFERAIARGLTPSEALSETLAKRQAGELEPLQLDPDTDPDMLTLPSMVEKIINDFISPEMRRKENLFLSTLLDTVNQYCEHGIPEVKAFLNWWDAKGSGIKLSVGRDLEALTIMTVHKSKGLEFPCVHYVATAPRAYQKNYIWIEGKKLHGLPKSVCPPLIPVKLGEWMLDTPLEAEYRQWCTQRNIDEVNLVYVALTRPVNELNIYYKATAEGKSAEGIYENVGRYLRQTAQHHPEVLTTTEDDPEIFISPTPPQGKLALEAERPGALDPEEEHPEVPTIELNRHDDLWKDTVLDTDFALPTGDAENEYPRREPDEELRQLQAIMTDLTDAGDEASVRLRHNPSPAVGKMLGRCMAARPEWFGENVTTGRIFTRRLKEGKRATGVVDRLLTHSDGSMELIIYKRSDLPTERQEAAVRRLMWIADLRRHKGSKAWLWDLAEGEARQVLPTE